MKQFLHAFLSPAEPGALIPILMTRNESRTQRLEGGRSGGRWRGRVLGGFTPSAAGPLKAGVHMERVGSAVRKKQLVQG